MKIPVFCKNCKWAVLGQSSALWQREFLCHNPMVNGQQAYTLSGVGEGSYRPCSWERDETGWFSVCGKKGKLYEPRES